MSLTSDYVLPYKVHRRISSVFHPYPDLRPNETSNVISDLADLRSGIANLPWKTLYIIYLTFLTIYPIFVLKTNSKTFDIWRHPT